MEEVGYAVALGPDGTLAVSLPGAEPAAVVVPDGLVGLHRHGVGGEEGGRIGGALAGGEGLGGFVDVGHLDGVEGVPGGGDDAVVDQVVLAVDIEVLGAGLQEGMGARKAEIGPGG